MIIVWILNSSPVKTNVDSFFALRVLAQACVMRVLARVEDRIFVARACPLAKGMGVKLVFVPRV